MGVVEIEGSSRHPRKHDRLSGRISRKIEWSDVDGPKTLGRSQQVRKVDSESIVKAFPEKVMVIKKPFSGERQGHL